MPAKRKKPSKKKNDDSVLFAFIATFFSILGFIIALLAKRDDKYVMFYAKQSLVIFLAWIVAAILRFIPVVGWLAMLFVTVLWVFSWIYALSGKEQHTPIIGELGDKINI